MRARAARITTMMTMPRRMITRDAQALARLLCFASPAFPTGGFAYSHGLEWAVEVRDVHDADTLRCWVGVVLTAGSGRSDAILLRQAYRAAADPVALGEIAELAAACAPSLERQAEVLGQGSAFALAARAWGAEATDAAYPVAFAAVAARQGIGEEAACIGYLSAVVGNLVSAGVRLIPLGQSDGLRVLAALEPTVLAVCDATRTGGLDDLGGACFRADIASMRHETQYSRMFRA
jgi:urease accessory protein